MGEVTGQPGWHNPNKTLHISYGVRYQSAWAEINAKGIARQNALNALVAGVCVLLAFCSPFVLDAKHDEWARAVISVVPCVFVFVFVVIIWYCAIDASIVLIARVCSELEKLDAEENPGVPAHFSSQGWLSHLNTYRFAANLALLICVLVGLVPLVAYLSWSPGKYAAGISIAIAAILTFASFWYVFRVTRLRQRVNAAKYSMQGDGAWRVTL